MWSSQLTTSLDRVAVIGAAPKKPVQITVDLQEKRPIRFPPDYVTTTVAHLKTFDYAVTGDTRWGIERKSIPDLVQSFLTHRAREIRKIERAAAQFDPDWPLIYLIDGRLADLIQYPWHRCPKMTSQRFISCLADITIVFRVQFFFCSDEQEVALWLYRYLRTRFKHLQKKDHHANCKEI